MKKIILASLILIFVSCKSEEKFEKDSIKKLYKSLKEHSEFESDLKENSLVQFLHNISIPELKKGRKVESESLFENFKCDCRDKLSISYSKEKELFELKIDESFFEKELDWCPETTYVFSFKMENNKITEVKLHQIAG